jgi:hypothetical protein
MIISRTRLSLLNSCHRHHLKSFINPSSILVFPRRVTPTPTRATMVTFTIPANGDASASASDQLTINSTPSDLTREQLLSFPAFQIWLSTLQRSLTLQKKNPSHEFHKNPYVLRSIEVQAVDYFRGGKLGFVKLRADVSNQTGESLPGSVFLRGGSVGMLVSLSFLFFFLLFLFFFWLEMSHQQEVKYASRKRHWQRSPRRRHMPANKQIHSFHIPRSAPPHY